MKKCLMLRPSLKNKKNPRRSETNRRRRLFRVKRVIIGLLPLGQKAHPGPPVPLLPKHWFGSISDNVQSCRRGSLQRAVFVVVSKANEAANRLNFLGLVSEQCLFNLASRMVEMDVLPACEDYGLGVIPWSPLAGGLLGGVLKKTSEGRRASDHI